jgi:hypothetical protein
VAANPGSAARALTIAAIAQGAIECGPRRGTSLIGGDDPFVVLCGDLFHSSICLVAPSLSDGASKATCRVSLFMTSQALGCDGRSASLIVRQEVGLLHGSAEQGWVAKQARNHSYAARCSTLVTSQSAAAERSGSTPKPGPSGRENTPA